MSKPPPDPPPHLPGTAAGVAFRRLTPADAALAQAAAPEVFDAAVAPQQAARFLSDPRNILIVAIAEGQVVGQVQAVLHAHPDAPPDFFLDNLGVAPGWQRRGIGRRLLALALEAGRRAGAAEGWVLAEPDRAAALALYREAAASVRQVAMFSFDLAGAAASDADAP